MSKIDTDAAQHAAAKADARWNRQFLEDLKTVIATATGRRFLSRLIFNKCKVMVTEQWVGNAEIHVIAGRRQIGEHLLGSLEEVAPAETRKMVDEWFKDRFEWRTEIERAGRAPAEENDE